MKAWGLGWVQGAVTAADLARLDASLAVVTKQVTALKDIDPTKAKDAEGTLAAIQEDLERVVGEIRVLDPGFKFELPAR